ncbi:hypothetical protein M5689_005942 [Euphorbia peplus]|nr:hypothetical protein M5689_005942 [Euphorbia peplus]
MANSFFPHAMRPQFTTTEPLVSAARTSSSQGPHPWRFDPFTGQHIRPQVLIPAHFEAPRILSGFLSWKPRKLLMQRKIEGCWLFLRVMVLPCHKKRPLKATLLLP